MFLVGDVVRKHQRDFIITGVSKEGYQMLRDDNVFWLANHQQEGWTVVGNMRTICARELVEVVRSC